MRIKQAENGFYARLIHRQMRSKDGAEEDLGGWVNPDDFDDVNTKKASSSSDKESILTGHVTLEPEIRPVPVVVTESDRSRLKDSASSSSSSSSSGDDNNV